jgi:hypothetical protein
VIDTPELEVLAAAAAGDRERQRARLPLLLDACDPARLLEQARAHAMTPALARALHGLPVEEPLRTRLAEAAAADRAVSKRLAAALSTVATAAERVVALKGPALGVLAWGDELARASRDLDLWSPDPSARKLKFDVQVDWEDRLAVGEPRTAWIEVAGAPIETPDVEDSALLLCADGLPKLGRVADLVALLEKADGARLAARARETGLTEALEAGKALAAEPRRWSPPRKGLLDAVRGLWN